MISFIVIKKTVRVNSYMHILKLKYLLTRGWLFTLSLELFGYVRSLNNIYEVDIFWFITPMWLSLGCLLHACTLSAIYYFHPPPETWAIYSPNSFIRKWKISLFNLYGLFLCSYRKQKQTFCSIIMFYYFRSNCTIIWQKC